MSTDYRTPSPRLAVAFVATAVLVGCPSMQSAPSLAPVPRAVYDFKPTPPCQPPNSSKITLAIVAPRWQGAGQVVAGQSAIQMNTLFSRPQLLTDLAQSMRGDFLELATCGGYLTKGPYDSFESMVYPDREGSNLILEPELQIDMDITNIAAVQRSVLEQIVTSRGATHQLTGSATVGGRITLSLKEPLTNTRMWARSIEVPAAAFDVTTENRYPREITMDQARYYVLNDGGFQRQAIPKLEAMYVSVLRTAQSYLDVKEITTVSVQAADVRKKAAIRVPPSKTESQ